MVLLGVENTVVVDTPDALLVGDIRRSQEVRELVDELNTKATALTRSSNRAVDRRFVIHCESTIPYEDRFKQTSRWFS